MPQAALATTPNSAAPPAGRRARRHALDSSRAEESGRSAYRAGTPRKDNPHTQGSASAAEWSRGYDDERDTTGPGRVGFKSTGARRGASDAVVQAAGLRVETPDGRALFLKRGPRGDHPGTWCWPGGEMEPGEDAATAAVRETREETGWVPEGEPEEVDQRDHDGVDFTTYRLGVNSPFIPTLDDEHVGWAWAPVDDPPEPLHPGVAEHLAVDAGEFNENDHPRRANGEFGEGGSNSGGKGGSRSPGGSERSGPEVKSDKTGIIEYGGVTDTQYHTWAESPNDVNGALSGTLKPGDVSDDGGRITEDDIAEFREIGEKLQKAASSNAVRAGALWRGESYDSEADLRAKYQINKRVTTERLTSTAVDRKTAEMYSSTDASGPVKAILEYGNKFLTMPGIQTAPLGVLSGEVVMPKGVTYRVAGIKKDAGGVFRISMYSTEKHDVPAVSAWRPPGYGGDAAAQPVHSAEVRRQIKFPAARGPGGEREVDEIYARSGAGRELRQAPEARRFEARGGLTERDPDPRAADRRRAKDEADFREADHPRAKGGKFTSGAAAGPGGKESGKAPAKEPVKSAEWTGRERDLPSRGKVASAARGAAKATGHRLLSSLGLVPHLGGQMELPGMEHRVRDTVRSSLHGRREAVDKFLSRPDVGKAIKKSITEGLEEHAVGTANTYWSGAVVFPVVHSILTTALPYLDLPVSGGFTSPAAIATTALSTVATYAIFTAVAKLGLSPFGAHKLIKSVVKGARASADASGHAGELPEWHLGGEEGGAGEAHAHDAGGSGFLAALAQLDEYLDQTPTEELTAQHPEDLAAGYGDEDDTDEDEAGDAEVGTAAHARGALSERQESEVERTPGEREEMPAGAFLLGAERKYPVKEKKDGEWAYSRQLLLAAARRARLSKNEALAARADAIREREFGGAAQDCDDLAHDSARYALDEGSKRNYDADGRLHVDVTHISKAAVNPYYGWEIPGWQELGLEPNRQYRLLRDPEELARAAPTFNGVPLLIQHKPATAADHPEELVIGSTGTDAAFNDPYLDNSLVVWPDHAIEEIETDEKKELSSAYRYRPDMTPGTYKGEPYDGVMRDIVGNHVALVKEGRAGADVVVGDSNTVGGRGAPTRETLMSKTIKLTRQAAIAVMGLASYLRPRMAQDAKLDLRPLFADVTAKNYAEKKASLARAIDKAARPHLARDASIGEVAEVLDLLDSHNVETDDVPPSLEKAMEAPPVERVRDARDRRARDDDPAASVEDFLKDKLSDEDLAHVCDLIRGGDEDDEDEFGEAREAREAAPVGDETEAEAAERERREDAKGAADKRAADKRAADKRRAADQPPPFRGRPEVGKGPPVDKKAMDAAIGHAVSSAQKKWEETQRGIRAAEREVRSWVGDIAMDEATCADDVYRLALDGLGVKVGDDVHPSAYAPILRAQPKPGEANKVPARRSSSIAMDAGSARSYAERFPDAARVGIL